MLLAELLLEELLLAELLLAELCLPLHELISAHGSCCTCCFKGYERVPWPSCRADSLPRKRFIEHQWPTLMLIEHNGYKI